MNNLISSIQCYHTIENEELFLFIKSDLQSVEIFQSDENLTLIPFTNTNETADLILIDDFTQSGWKQILFLKNPLNFNSFILTDFSQIHIFQQGSDFEYNVCKIMLNNKTKKTNKNYFLDGRKTFICRYG
jgi:hypothetical protein